MNCKKILSIPIVLSLLLLVAATAHIFYPPLNNWKLLLEGKKNTYTLFQPLGSIDEMGEDFSARTNLRFAETAMTGPQVFTPKRDIPYYSSPNGLTPVYTLKAGHTYATYHSMGYGFYSFPTFNREWRYAYPFREVNREEYLQLGYFTETEPLPSGYIRLSDLEDLASGKAAFLEVEYSPKLYEVDTLMYMYKYAYSPSSAPIFDIWNISFLLGGLLLLGILLFWMGKSWKQAKKEPKSTP